MQLHRQSLLACGLLSLALLVGFDQAFAQGLPVLTGRQLFEREWQIHDPLCPDGDGLGPCFNATSCVACHHQTGPGGGGINEHNVDLLTLKTPPAEVVAMAKRERREPMRLHPNFIQGSTTIILHAAGTYTDYDAFRLQMLGLAQPANLSPVAKARFWGAMAKRERTAATVEELTVDGVRLQRTQRNTPALFGAGLIDEIADEVLLALEKEQADKKANVTGRVSRARPALQHPFAPQGEQPAGRLDRVSRFGWRGQTVNLADFVLGACANEVGLSMPQHKQAIDPLRPLRDKTPRDLSDEQCQKLIAFVRDLPRPRQVLPRDPKAVAEVLRGDKLFTASGCADCHQPTLAGVGDLYSDLLLHDLGAELADPLPALPQLAEVGNEFSAGYYGAEIPRNLLAKFPTSIQQEWRTPPLWGVADSGPYLHDGRAGNLHQAIMLHGGEGSDARQSYTRLSEPERRALLAFLGTLQAPR